MKSIKEVSEELENDLQQYTNHVTTSIIRGFSRNVVP